MKRTYDWMAAAAMTVLIGMMSPASASQFSASEQKLLAREVSKQCNTRFRQDPDLKDLLPSIRSRFCACFSEQLPKALKRGDVVSMGLANAKEKKMLKARHEAVGKRVGETCLKRVSN